SQTPQRLKAAIRDRDLHGLFPEPERPAEMKRAVQVAAVRRKHGKHGSIHDSIQEVLIKGFRAHWSVEKTVNLPTSGFEEKFEVVDFFIVAEGQASLPDVEDIPEIGVGIRPCREGTNQKQIGSGRSVSQKLTRGQRVVPRPVVRLDLAQDLARWREWQIIKH